MIIQELAMAESKLLLLPKNWLPIKELILNLVREVVMVEELLRKILTVLCLQLKLPLLLQQLLQLRQQPFSRFIASTRNEGYTDHAA